ncbi:hypothetical protein ACFLV0_02290 [Chloroflexota bacterium]
MWGSGFATGIGVGFAIGLIVGSLTAKQKSWSELTDREKKTRIWLVGTGIILLIAGIIAFLLFR